jgi:hypothetical protein
MKRNKNLFNKTKCYSIMFMIKRRKNKYFIPYLEESIKNKHYKILQLKNQEFLRLRTVLLSKIIA